MSLKHLFAGLVGVFALALGVNPRTVAPEAAPAVAVPSEQVQAIASADASPQGAAKDREKDRIGERSKDEDGQESRDTAWARRLIFPSGNKF